MTWVNTIVEAASAFIPGSLNLNVSTPNVATDSNYLSYDTNAAPIQCSSTTPFTFNRVYFIAAQTEGLNIIVKGLSSGIIVDQASFVVGTLTPILGTFNWANVDTVIMSTSGSADRTKHQSFAFDNVVVNAAPLVAAVPEPDTYALLLVGLGAGAFVARGRHRAHAK